MAEDIDPIVQRRRVAHALRRLRTERGLKQVQVATDLDWSHAKVVRIENGNVGISGTDLRALMAYYGVDDEQLTAELLEMARAARQQRFTAYADVLSRDYLLYLAYEGAAKIIHKYEASAIPGLLQTPDYTNAILRTINPDEPDQLIRRRAEPRQHRQELLKRDHRPELHIIMDEAVLRRQVGAEQENPTLMLDQLAHLQQLAKQPGVKLQVVPFAAGAHPGMAGSFTVLQFPDPADSSLLYQEGARGDSTTRDNPTETQRHLNTFFALQNIATRPEDTSAFIEAVARDMRAGRPTTT
jgi:transcriptional regulator with XRE-family HTH domain